MSGPALIPPPLPSQRQTPRLLIVASIALTVWLLIVMSVTLITFLLPATFAGTTRLLVNPAPGGPAAVAPPWTPAFAQTQIQLIPSEQVLHQVSEHLDLPAKWSAKYHTPNRFTPAEVVRLLKAQLEVRPVRNTSLLDLTFTSQDPQEAAALANEIAATFQSISADRTPRVLVAVVETATVPAHPIRPNKPLTIALGMAAASFVALCVGALVYMLQWRAQQPKSAL